MARIHKEQFAPAGLGVVESGIEFFVEELTLFFFFASSTCPGIVPTLRRRSPSRFRKARTCEYPRRIPVNFSMAAWACLTVEGGFFSKYSLSVPACLFNSLSRPRYSLFFNASIPPRLYRFT